MHIKQGIKALARILGYDIVRYDYRQHNLARRTFLLNEFGITAVLDVGANAGQYGTQLRRLGYAGRMTSFEPLSAAFAMLQQRAGGDRNWKTVRLALGDRDGEATIHVAANSCSSSLLDMLPAHAAASPGSRYVGAEIVPVKRLDDIFQEHVAVGDRILLKLDVQGYEPQVLAGAREALRRIDTLQIESSVVPLYRGEMLFPDIYRLVYDLGFRLCLIEHGFETPATGELLQVECIFHRYPPAENGI
jgi:FkbM family methyltransferase